MMRNYTLGSLFLLMLCLMAMPAVAQNWDTFFTQGQQALAKKDYKAAATALERALPSAEQEFKTQHPNYVKTLYALAEAYKGLGDTKKERTCYLTLINVKKDLREDRTKEFAQLQFLTAVTYVQTKEAANADNYFTQSLNLQRYLKQEQTADFVITQHEYARLLRLINRLDKAEAQYVPAFEQGIKTLGNKNPRMAEMASEMADVYFRMKNYEKANEFNLKWIELAKAQQVPEAQYYTAYLQLHLGYKFLNNPQESVRYGNEYINGVKAHNGNKLIEELDKMLASYAEMNATDAALAIARQKADAVKAAKTEQSMEFATALAQVAVAELRKDKSAEAESSLKKAIEISKANKKTPEHETLYVEQLAQLAALYKQMGNKSKAESVLWEVVEQSKKLNDKQVQHARAIDSLAFYYVSIENFSKADSLFKANIELRKKNLTDKSPEYGASLMNYADFLIAQDKPEVAEPLLKQANMIDGTYYGRGSIEFTRSMLKLGDLAALRKNYPEALRIYRSMLNNQRKLQGEQSPDYQATLKKIADITAEMNKK
ncbi:tetratricopeptide repeat protein [Rhodoflexus sp.]